LFVLFSVMAAPPVSCVVALKLLPKMAALAPVPVCVMALKAVNVMLLVVLIPATLNPATP